MTRLILYLLFFFATPSLVAQVVYESPVGFRVAFNKTWKRVPKEVLQKRLEEMSVFLNQPKPTRIDACFQKRGSNEMDYPLMMLKNYYATTTDEKEIEKLVTDFRDQGKIDATVRNMVHGKFDATLSIGTSYYDQAKKIILVTYNIGTSIKGAMVGINALIIGKSACLQVIAYSYKDEFPYDQKEFLQIIYGISDKGLEKPMGTYLNAHDEAVGYFNQGKMASDQGNRQEAIRLYTIAIQRYPSEDKYIKAEALYNRGLNKRYLNDFTGAIADYTLAIAIRPDYAKAYNNRGYARMQLDQYQLAISDFTQTIKLDNNNSEFTAMAYGNRGIAKLAVGIDGCEDLKKAADLGNSSYQKVQQQYCK